MKTTSCLVIHEPRLGLRQGGAEGVVRVAGTGAAAEVERARRRVAIVAATVKPRARAAGEAGVRASYTTSRFPSTCTRCST